MIFGIRWQSIVADETGTIDYVRVRSLVAVLLALVGGAATIGVIFWDPGSSVDVSEGLVGIMVAACVAPLTGGRIADVIKSAREKKETERINRGHVPGRRASDPSIPRSRVDNPDEPIA